MLQCGHGTKAVENYDSTVSLPTARSQLQCGHGTKAVENPGRRATDVCDGHWLQCGHGTKAVENGRSRRRRRPRCWRFNAATARRPWRTFVDPSRLALGVRASMRPRHEGRGEPAVVSTSAINAAALQCGHGTKAVENSSIWQTYGVHDRGFNAATARRPWRTWRRKSPMATAANASMRPRHEGRGEPPTCNPIAHAHHRFNAATARRPWRTAKSGGSRCRPS